MNCRGLTGPEPEATITPGHLQNALAMDTLHEHFMRKALEVAQQGLDQGELPIGAVVVLDNQVIAAAHTRERAENRLLVHADLLALETADRLQPFPGKRRDARLYVNLEPCLMCLGAAMSFFIGAIYYVVAVRGRAVEIEADAVTGEGLIG